MNQSDKRQPDALLEMSSSRPGNNEQPDDYNNVNFLDDDIMGTDQVESWDTFDSFAADMIMAYGEFPNTLAEETVVVTQEFPSMVQQDSFSHMATPGFTEEVERYSYSQPSMEQGYPTVTLEDQQ